MKAYYRLNSDGTHENLDRELDLEQIQAIVGGYVESIHLGKSALGRRHSKDRWLFVNEEGKLLNLPENATATRMLREFRPDLFTLFPYMTVVGDVIVGQPYRWPEEGYSQCPFRLAP